jgi:hypothetical protein
MSTRREGKLPRLPFSTSTREILVTKDEGMRDAEIRSENHSASLRPLGVVIVIWTVPYLR